MAFRSIAFTVAGLLMPSLAAGQTPPQLPPGVLALPGVIVRNPTPNDTLVSPIVEGSRITFNVYAPDAQSVTVQGEMFPFGKGLALTKAPNGVWSGAADRVLGGTYRYVFRIDGVDTVDPRNTESTRSQSRVQSLVHVNGEALEDIADVPHGALSLVYYKSAVFGQPRRMHIYTPPGYSPANGRYPVLYLLHGGGDSDDSWGKIGREGFILDNLIAAGKAKPMIVVMPAGHVPGSSGSVASASIAVSEDAGNDPFTGDLLKTIIPYVESHYAASNRAEDRAIAGLSMGGIQTANIGLTNTDKFLWVGIFSSGWLHEVRAKFEALHGKDMDLASKRLRLLWVGYGKTDVANPYSKEMLKMFTRHGLKYEETETEGGHSWYNWRHYLEDFAPKLFR